MRDASLELLAHGSVEIERSCPEVFAYVANMENFPAWFPGVSSMRGHGPLDHAQVGKRYSETLRMPFGRTATIDLEVKEARAGSHLTTEGEGFLMPRMSVDLTTLSDGRTRVDWRMVSRNPGWWFRSLVAPVVRHVMRGRARDGLRRLRDNLERVGARSDGSVGASSPRRHP